jgi:EPS-associated MarR family transcriptional regulator
LLALAGCNRIIESSFTEPSTFGKPMTSRRHLINEDTHFWTLKHLQQNPSMSQRALAKEVGISVSGINYCIKALIEKGWLKMGNFANNPNKLNYAYLLTPAGVSEKAALTARFLKRKMAEYDKLREEIEALQLADSEVIAHHNVAPTPFSESVRLPQSTK